MKTSGTFTANPAGSSRFSSRLNPLPTSGIEQGDEPAQEINNFENLMGKLVKVPKSEIDQKRQKA
jgi:hypothetical protein